jgi:hypothetical protein
MTRVNVIVEGQTEEAFVKNVLAPHLQPRQIYLRPLLTPLKRGARKRKLRGGIAGSFASAQRFVHRKLTDDTEAYTTTMFDYYGLPIDFPGMDHADLPPPARWQERVAFLEEQFSEALSDSQRFIPYVQTHEFEALLFSDAEVIDRTLSILQQASGQLNELRGIVAACGEPEAIDDSPETAPSKRLKQLYPSYDKVLFGELITEEIGIETLCSQCPHFANWIEQLRRL